MNPSVDKQPREFFVMIPFDISMLLGYSSLFPVIVHAVIVNDDALIFDHIDSLIAEVDFPSETDREFCETTLIDAVRRSYDYIYYLAEKSPASKYLREFDIYECIPVGQDLQVLFAQIEELH